MDCCKDFKEWLKRPLMDGKQDVLKFPLMILIIPWFPNLRAKFSWPNPKSLSLVHMVRIMHKPLDALVIQDPKPS
jgi:hypothetical protein